MSPPTDLEVLTEEERERTPSFRITPSVSPGMSVLLDVYWTLLRPPRRTETMRWGRALPNAARLAFGPDVTAPASGR